MLSPCRISKLCSGESLDTELAQLKGVFQENGYPTSIINQTLYSSNSAPSTNTDQDTDTTWVSMPYVRGVSERIAKSLSKANIKIAHKAGPSLRQTLSHLKDRPSFAKRKGVIYKIPCNCGKCYVGETYRHVGKRLSEHQSDVRNSSQRSALTTHNESCSQQIDWSSTTILASVSRWQQRLCREALEIREHHAGPGQGLNRDHGNYKLSPHWITVADTLNSSNSLHNYRRPIIASQSSPEDGGDNTSES